MYNAGDRFRADIGVCLSFYELDTHTHAHCQPHTYFTINYSVLQN